MRCACGQPLTLQDRGLFWAATEADVQAWTQKQPPAHAVYAARCGARLLAPGRCVPHGLASGAGLTLQEAGTQLGVSYTTVRARLQAGTLVGVRVPHPRGRQGYQWRVFLDKGAV